MKRFGLVVCLAVAFAAAAQAQTMTLIEDFEAYPEEATIHDQGDWASTGGSMVGPGWQAQRNSSALADHGWSTVEDISGRNVLQLINRDIGGELDTVYTAMHMGSDNYIYDQGTLYVRFMALQDGDMVMAINDYWPGWDYDGIETGDAAAPDYQGTATGVGASYANSAALVELSAEPWRARNGGVYEQGLGTQPTKVVGQWYEMWMQPDYTGPNAASCRYYLCEDGGTPTVVLTAAGSEWWAFRLTASSMLTNVKFFAGLDDGLIERQVYIDTVAVNTTEFSTERYDGWVLFPKGLQADFDEDGDVDLDDFVILKSNFGTGTTHAEGDADLDGDVDLDDFVILKNEFGS